jgi:Leucine-rich repeat (LRR) protein
MVATVDLDDILAAEPSAGAWDQLVEVVYSWPPDAQDLERVATRLESWPDRLRAASRTELLGLQAGEAPSAAWMLARHLTLKPRDALEPVDALLHLTSLELRDGEQDLAPLPSLKKLRALDISGHHYADSLDFVAELPQLETLVVASIRAHDIEPLVGLSRLARLVLSHNVINDFGPLGALRGLRELELEDCAGLRDLSPLRPLQQLESLTLGRDYVYDLSPLASLPQLRRLRLRAAPEKLDLRVLAGLPLLQIVH